MSIISFFKGIRDTPQYGSIYVHNGAGTLTSVAQNDWDQITGYTTNGTTRGALTPDYANNRIIIGLSGDYDVCFSWSGYGPAVAHDWVFQVKKNSGTVSFAALSTHVTTPITQNITSCAISDVISFTKNDEVELWTQRTSAGSNILLTNVHALLKVVRVGP